jgi:hypothetical protein
VTVDGTTPQTEARDQPTGERSAMPRSARLRTIDWRPILLEAFFVVLGVVLALAANEWRQSIADRRSAARALESIREEIASNRQAVLASARYHIQLTDTLNALRRLAASAPDSGVPSPRVFSQGFVSPAALLSTAWEAAAATDAVRHMDHDDVLVLARIYEQQRRYATQTDEIGGLIYRELFDRGTTGIVRNYANLSSIIAALWYRECGLLAGYDRALAELRDGTVEAASDLPARCRRATS